MLENIEPKRVFYYFEEISKIPRPSYHEKAISDYLVSFAKEQGLEHIQDELGNVIIIKPATAGYENKPAIVIQGHMDMVCEKTSDCDKDMEKEGLDLVLEGDILSARGTTLGGDDGIAVAYALALLEDDTLKHPRLEVVITVAEEVGMDGARGIDVSPLQGRIFLNIDCELEGRCLASCAGGGTAHITLPIKRGSAAGKCYEVSVLGGRGGHSGDEINKGRANATVILGRVLRAIDEKCEWRLCSITGGSKDNAIPREAKAVIIVEDEAALAAVIKEQDAAVRSEFSKTDAGLFIEMKPAAAAEDPMTEESSGQTLLLISSLPNGIRRMSRDIEGLVETSLNMGITTTSQDEVVLGFAIRSSVSSAYDALKNRVCYVAKSLGATVEMNGEYPAWQYVAESPLREKMISIYRDMTGKELKVQAIHAGLECGLFAGKMPGLDAVSFGPDIYDIHTPDEHLSVSSVARVYDFIRKIIEEL
ncbi:MAG: aminoacyl-histidine dipeptidase [Lachnospiraceae bacterium]|nr:aminoacyl-histidine dipeptidase [Lachnospiraceae bacterium]